MPSVITANRLTDGIVVYLASDGEWTEQIAEARLAGPLDGIEPPVPKNNSSLSGS